MASQNVFDSVDISDVPKEFSWLKPQEILVEFGMIVRHKSQLHRFPVRFLVLIPWYVHKWRFHVATQSAATVQTVSSHKV